MKNFKVETTKDYNKFLHIIGNREINKSNLKRLKESIREIGLQVPILVNENRAVVDGQHRLQALRELNLPVTYIQSQITREEHIPNLQVSKLWTALDFAKRNAAQGDKECIKALKVVDNWHELTNKKFAKIVILELLNKAQSNTLKPYLKNKSYKVDIDNAIRVFNCQNILNKNRSVRFNPYTAKNMRALKKLNKNMKGLKYKVIEKFNKHYLDSFASGQEQYNYLKDLYKKYDR
ncbi:MAG: hypothetical protein GOVbin2950_18 [Prokaryotic dsDNA virus sp.]|nr:MAG: hypothetical protein GOVbin2950_18 [Prokaryotic dsDNA virus sp.]|tara:strand:- start:1227 stop:1931 length:705 start_codon:yes stop_codon:yes gene_type:complete